MSTKTMDDFTQEMNGLISEMQGTTNNIRNIDHIVYCERDVHYMELIIRNMVRVQKRMATKVAKYIDKAEDEES